MLGRPNAEMRRRAAIWMVELQCGDEKELDENWPKFDAWFQAKEAHRIAYKEVHDHWLKINGLPPDPAYQPRYKRPPTVAQAIWEDRVVCVLILAAIVLWFTFGS